MRNVAAGLGCCLCWFATPQAHAEFVPDASFGATSSDNANRATTDGASDTQVSLRGGINYWFNGKLLDLDVQAAAAHSEYPGKEVASDTRFWGQLRSQLLLIPDYLSWDLQFDQGQVATDPFGSFRPADLQDVNFFSTGPDVAIPAGDDNRIEIEGRFSRLSYETDNNQDNDRYSVNLGFAHAMSAIRNIGAAFYTQSVKYNSGGASFFDYKLTNVSAAMSSAARRTTINAQIGYSQSDSTNVTTRVPLAFVSFERKITASSQIGLVLRSGYADGVDAFRFLQSSGGSTVLVPQNVRVIAAPFKQKLASIEYRLRTPRRSFGVSALFSKEDFEGASQLARRNVGGTINAGYVLSPSSRIDGYATYTSNQNATATQDSRDLSFGVAYTRKLTNTINMLLRVDRYSRRADSVPFDENRVGLALTYAPRSERVSNRQGFMQRTRGLSGRPTKSLTAEPRSNDQ